MMVKLSKDTEGKVVSQENSIRGYFLGFLNKNRQADPKTYTRN
jgi:hypothetical protein